MQRIESFNASTFFGLESKSKGLIAFPQKKATADDDVRNNQIHVLIWEAGNGVGGLHSFMGVLV